MISTDIRQGREFVTTAATDEILGFPLTILWCHLGGEYLITAGGGGNQGSLFGLYWLDKDWAMVLSVVF